MFVFNFTATEVNLGDVVRVTGSVSEFQDQTQISAWLNGVDVRTTGATVAPTDVQLPFASEAGS